MPLSQEPPRPRYVLPGPPPGPQHSRSTGSTAWYVARIVSLCVLAVALISVPVAWVQRSEATTRGDGSEASGPNADLTADELGYSPATASPTTEATAEPSASTPTPTVATDLPTTGPTVGAAPAPSTSPTPQATATATAPPASAPTQAAAPPPAAVPAAPPVVAAPPLSLSDEIVRLTNVERANRGLQPLTSNPCLTSQSAGRTAVLVTEGRFEHDSLDPVIAACGMPHSIGENLILGYPDAASAVAGWMGSEGHRANILNPGFTEIGVACTLGPKGQLCGQLFLG